MIRSYRRTLWTLPLLAAVLLSAGMCPTDAAPGFAKASSILMDPATMDLAPGETKPLVCSPKDAAGTNLTIVPVIIWSSDNADVASPADMSNTTTETLNAVTAGNPGVAHVTCKVVVDGKDVVGTSTVTVHPLQVTVTPPGSAFYPTGAADIVAEVKDHRGANYPLSGGKSILWVSDKPSTATVAKHGTDPLKAIITGVAPGTAKLSAMVHPSASNTAVKLGEGSANVTISQFPLNLAISGTNTMKAGTSVQLFVSVKDHNFANVTDAVVEWTTSNPTGTSFLVSNNQQAVVKGDAVGSATITAKATRLSGATGTTTFNVTVTTP